MKKCLKNKQKLSNNFCVAPRKISKIFSSLIAIFFGICWLFSLSSYGANCQSKEQCNSIKEYIIAMVGDGAEGGIYNAEQCILLATEIMDDQQQISNRLNNAESAIIQLNINCKWDFEHNNIGSNLYSTCPYQAEINEASNQVAAAKSRLASIQEKADYVLSNGEQARSTLAQIATLASDLPCENCCGAADTNCVINCLTNNFDGITEIVCQTNCDSSVGNTNECCCCDFEWLKTDLDEVLALLRRLLQMVQDIRDYTEKMKSWVDAYEGLKQYPLSDQWRISLQIPLPEINEGQEVVTNHLPFFSYTQPGVEYYKLSGNYLVDSINLLKYIRAENNLQNAVLANISSNLAVRLETENIIKSNDATVAGMEVQMNDLTNGNRNLHLTFTNDLHALEFKPLDFYWMIGSGGVGSQLTFDIPEFKLNNHGLNAQKVIVQFSPEMHYVFEAVRTMSCIVIWSLCIYILLMVFRFVLNIIIWILRGITKIKDMWS